MGPSWVPITTAVPPVTGDRSFRTRQYLKHTSLRVGGSQSRGHDRLLIFTLDFGDFYRFLVRL